MLKIQNLAGKKLKIQGLAGKKLKIQDFAGEMLKIQDQMILQLTGVNSLLVTHHFLIIPLLNSVITLAVGSYSREIKTQNKLYNRGF